MEWYDWIFAVTGASTAFAALAMSALIYSEVRARGSGGPRPRHPRRGG